MMIDLTWLADFQFTLVGFLLRVAWDTAWIVFPLSLLVGGLMLVIRKQLRIVGQHELHGHGAVLVGRAMIITFVLYLGSFLFEVLFTTGFAHAITYYVLINGPWPLPLPLYILHVSVVAQVTALIYLVSPIALFVTFIMFLVHANQPAEAYESLSA